MNKLLPLLAFSIIAFSTKAQQQTTPIVQPFGKIDQADLEMKACDFEKNANAEVLFDIGIMQPAANGPFNLYRHIRIKVFNEQGENQGSIRLVYGSYHGAIGLSDLHAETVNLENGKQENTLLDKKAIYTETLDNFTSAVAFAMPNVKPGSIIDIEYKGYFPDSWYFQNNIPIRYSEIQTSFSALSDYKCIPHITQPFVKSIGTADDVNQTRALANIPSLHDEAFMSSREDNLERIDYINTVNQNFNTWQKVGDKIVRYTSFTDELDRNLTGEKAIIKTAKSFKTEDEKIAFIFDTVKNAMKWNSLRNFAPKDGVSKAWDNKVGNSAEINIIVYDLLKKSGVKAYPLIVSTKESGKLNPIVPSPWALRNLVVYIPVDSAKTYVLDATNKFNLYNVISQNELNKFGLRMDIDNKTYKPVFIEYDDPVMQSVFLNAEIKPDGKLNGTAQITSFSYNKIQLSGRYKTDGEEKYISYLKNDDNNLKITSFKMGNMDVDSLPLVQDINFDLALAGSDDNYIYFNPNQLTGLNKNPFLSETRNTDIDFGYRDNLILNGVYKLPAGYKVDALPKNISMTMPDASITFRRTLTEQDGTIVIRYVINHRQSLYLKDVYPDFFQFYKKLYELLNEQIVLKKS